MLLESDCVYVDKTALALNLIKIPGRFFLSRPRRFGKSLFVDTLKEIFEGNEQLFRGLYIHDKWDWGRKFPVIKIDFAGGVLKSREELDEKIRHILAAQGARLGVSSVQKSVSGLFGDILSGVAQTHWCLAAPGATWFGQIGEARGRRDPPSKRLRVHRP